MTAAASIYVRNGVAFVVSASRTTDGFWIEQEPYFMDDNVDPQVLAAQVTEALDASKFDVPTPSSESIASRLPELAGVKSFAIFMRGAVSVDISRDAGGITVTPMRNAGPRAGFEFLGSQSRRIESAADLAEVLAEAIQHAE